MTKNELIIKINEISEMDRSDLENIKEQVFLSEINDKAKYFLLEEIGKRDEVIGNIADALVISSETKVGEL